LYESTDNDNNTVNNNTVNSNTVNPSRGSTSSGNGTSFYGIDTALYPGDAAMQAWWNDSPFYYTGFYLGPAPDHPDASFMDKRQMLGNQGWGLLPVYVGHQAAYRYLSAQTGAWNADDAAGLMATAGFPPNTAVFLDVEASRPLSDRYLGYVTAWVNEIRTQGYTAGIYCNTASANQISSALSGNVEFWVAHYTGYSLPSCIPSPADSGISCAGAWQFTGDSYLSYGGIRLDIDLDTSSYTDPSTETVNIKK
jgi:GH25 family lysozyme M1 (1,4-beta-N-acetylmuramidase)